MEGGGRLQLLLKTWELIGNLRTMPSLSKRQLFFLFVIVYLLFWQMFPYCQYDAKIIKKLVTNPDRL